MAVRATMAALIQSVRTLINDPAGASQIFDDQTIQDVLDESRQDYGNELLDVVPTYVGNTIKYLDYYHELGGWEDGATFRQFLSGIVTPSVSEPIAGHWSFATSTFPPVYISGSLHDRWRAAADLLERMAARWVLQFNFSSDGQSFQRAQASHALQTLAKTYRLKQRAGTMSMVRSDFADQATQADNVLGPRPIDYMS